MSGFGNFNKIGGNNPANTIYTGNVEIIRQPDDNPQPENVGGEEPLNEAPGKPGARELAGKLDVLLLQAGKLAAKGIDAAALKAEVGEFGLKKYKGTDNLLKFHPQIIANLHKSRDIRMDFWIGNSREKYRPRCGIWLPLLPRQGRDAITLRRGLSREMPEGCGALHASAPQPCHTPVHSLAVPLGLG